MKKTITALLLIITSTCIAQVDAAIDAKINIKAMEILAQLNEMGIIIEAEKKGTFIIDTLKVPELNKSQIVTVSITNGVLTGGKKILITNLNGVLKTKLLNYITVTSGLTITAPIINGQPVVQISGSSTNNNYTYTRLNF